MLAVPYSRSTGIIMEAWFFATDDCTIAQHLKETENDRVIANTMLVSCYLVAHQLRVK
jgi:hypothetical protein